MVGGLSVLNVCFSGGLLCIIHEYLLFKREKKPHLNTIFLCVFAPEHIGFLCVFVCVAEVVVLTLSS